jgi:hypothetical protein
MPDDGVGVRLADDVRLEEVPGLEQLDSHDAAIVRIRDAVGVLPQGFPLTVVVHDRDVQRRFPSLNNNKIKRRWM